MGGHGVMGATASGLGVARAILGCKMADLLQADGPEIQILPAEAPEQWPERLRRRVPTG
jgi:hypothetical protein